MVAGLILAAGDGSRFGTAPKQLAMLGDRPLLQHALDAHLAVTELERVVVVLGASARDILAGLRMGRAEAVVCPEWASGQSASLRAGARALAGAERVVCTLGDQPLIGSDLIARFAAEAPGTRAAYHGRPGHPVVLGPGQLAAIERVTGDEGARSLLADARLVECAGLGSDRDVDTAGDLDAIRALR
jgi:CTP:molybdopterin cytidylyltransferase MocA